MARDYSSKIEQARAQLQQLQAKASTEQRKLENRQKIIIGSIVINTMGIDENFKTQITALLASHVTRKADREAIKAWLPTT